MSDDLIQRLRALLADNEPQLFETEKHTLNEAADTLASKDAALAEIRAEYLNASHDAMKLAAELARERELKDHARKCCDTAESALVRVRKALEDLANAKALKGVRELVAGWNGEYRTDGPYDRHPSELGATMPPTNCGAVYQLDEAVTAAHRALFETRSASRAISQDGEERS